jgi:hypothetical protein
MDRRTLIASRIDLHLRRHLGTRLDCYRALTDADYVRDVLLVCDAMQGTDLPLLARQFRSAGEHAARSTPAPGHDAGPPQGWAADTSGFGLSLPPLADELPLGNATRARPWFSPRRWFGA